MNDFIAWIVDAKKAIRLYNLQFEDSTRNGVITKAKNYIKENWDIFKDIEEFYIISKDNRELPDIVWMPIEIINYDGIISTTNTIDTKYIKEVNKNYYKEIK